MEGGSGRSGKVHEGVVISLCCGKLLQIEGSAIKNNLEKRALSFGKERLLFRFLFVRHAEAGSGWPRNANNHFGAERPDSARGSEEACARE